MNRVQSYVFWSTSQARRLVRNVLMKEPKIGMHHQQLFNEIIKQYPDEKLPTHLVPDAPQKPPVRGGAYLKPAPALVDHPVRSMRYLKKVILEDMLRLQEVEKVIVTRDHEEKRTRTKALFVKHPEPVDAAEMYRWRVVPGSAPTHDAPDPDPKEMFEAKRVEAWRKRVQEKNKMLPPARRLSTRYPPPPKRIMWLREREWKDKGLDYDPFALNEGRRGLLSESGYHRSRAPRRPDERQDTFSSTEGVYEASESAQLETEPTSSAPETGEQEVDSVLFPEDDDFTSYRRSSERRDGYLNHRREFSLAAGQSTRETKASENLSIPPFPKFTELEIGEKERERLQSWRDNGVEEKKQQENQHQPPPAASTSQNDSPQINFLERGLHSSVYVRPSKPRAPCKEPEPERDLPEDIQPPRFDTRLEDDSRHPSDTDRESTLGAEITFLQAEPYERSRRPRGPPKEPEPERWDRDLPEDILPPPIDTRKDAPRPMADLKMHVSPTVGVRHSRATRLYESLVRKSMTGPYAVPRLIIERDRPAYLRSPVRREPSKGGEDDIED
ncbi:hypothetical protein ARMGADRAFT_1015634 [Armillaria gallica]|uniref:Uncharacterized protein n=1 Tax=Armillaria gallica TaxID=47427 RepID=A0A2H3DKY3_ARMGA|nr:hypothetical protein ARMGADRAFT_1015634 [Armillaria gallica]